MSDTTKEAQEVLEEQKLAQPIDGEIEVIPQNGDEAEAGEESIEEGLPGMSPSERDIKIAMADIDQVPPVTIHILAPGHARTLNKSLGPQPTLTLLPQSHETIQELKLAVNECLAGYWLGPYSLRIPAGKGKKGGEKVKPKQAAERESAVIGEGDRLSEWLEVGDVFAGFDDKEERVLEVVRGKSVRGYTFCQPSDPFQSPTRTLALVRPSYACSSSFPLSDLRRIPSQIQSLSIPELAFSRLLETARQPSPLTKKSRSLSLARRARARRRSSRSRRRLRTLSPIGPMSGLKLSSAVCQSLKERSRPSLV